MNIAIKNRFRRLSFTTNGGLMVYLDSLCSCNLKVCFELGGQKRLFSISGAFKLQSEEVDKQTIGRQELDKSFMRRPADTLGHFTRCMQSGGTTFSEPILHKCVSVCLRL